jgi:hypothetical protein
LGEKAVGVLAHGDSGGDDEKCGILANYRTRPKPHMTKDAHQTRNLWEDG